MGFQGNGIAIVDLNGRITFANTFACKLAGTTPEEVNGMSCFDFVSEEERELAKGLLQGTERREKRPLRFRIRRQDGSAVWVRIQGSVIKGANAVQLEFSPLPRQPRA
ncbi:MAG TPA: PAS domain S-box protein [Candidatus Acidoferrales bacterium]|nr:PAS domain S-box protein [Candidatus Acidoferrales bacterium]